MPSHLALVYLWYSFYTTFIANILRLDPAVLTLLVLILSFYRMTLHGIYSLTHFNVPRYFTFRSFCFYLTVSRTTDSCWIRWFYIIWPYSAILIFFSRLWLSWQECSPFDTASKLLDVNPLIYPPAQLHSTCMPAETPQSGVRAVTSVAYKALSALEPLC